MHRVLRFSVLALFLLSTACDGDGPGDTDAGGSDGGGSDGGGGGACAGAADGTECGSGMICVGGDCVTATCGDGFMSMTEECDDGNDVAFDGCEPGTCTYTCHEDPECDDGRVCNGDELCDPTAHVCAPGVPPDAGTTCDLGGTSGVCRGTECVDPGCGNGVVDGSEVCDDGNDVDGDGCDTDCTYSCAEDMDCIDSDVCNGSETCDTVTHACVTGTAMVCDDMSPCTMDICDPTEGCQYPLIDGDMDGHAADSLGACGDDCNDSRADVYTGAEELCDGVDNNCNGDTDEVAPTWYVDCDGDGFAGSTDGSRAGCSMPDPATTGCGGGWVNTRPVDMSNTDCHDGNANVFPGQTMYFTSSYTTPTGGRSFDYNCNGSEEKSAALCTSESASCSRPSAGAACSGSSGYIYDDCTLSCTGTFCFYFGPACGTTGRYTSCNSAICIPRCTGDPPCIRLTSNRVQSCR